MRVREFLTPESPPSMSGLEPAPKRPPALRLPGGWITAAVPLIWLLGLGAWVVVRWSQLPPLIPIHWDLRGFPDFWVRRTPSAVLSVMGTMGAICLAFIALAWLMLQQPPQTSREALAAERTFRRHTALLIVVSAWFIAFSPAFSLLPLPFGAFRVWMVLFAATLFTGVIALVRSGVRMRRGRNAARPGPQSSPPEAGFWRGPFYFNRRSRSLFVRKRLGAGYTLNFANPWAWVVLAVLFGGAFLLARFFNR